MTPNEIMIGNIDLSTFSNKKEELQKLHDQYKDLKISGIDDKEGYKKVDEARKILKKERSGISNKRKELGQILTKAGKDMIVMEKNFIAIIQPLENKFKEQQDKIDELKEIEKRKILLPERKENLEKINIEISDEEILKMDSDEFQKFYNNKKEEFLAEKERILQEEQRKIQEEKERKEAEERARIEAEEREKQRQIDIEKAKKEAIKQAKQKAEEKARKEKEEAERKHREELEKIEREKQELIRKQEEEKKQKEQEELRKKQELEAQKKREQEETERLQKEEKYKNFLKKNEGKFDKILKEDGRVILYKTVDEFII